MNKSSHLIQFEKLKWKYPANGLREKTFIEGKSRLRLLSLEDTFTEENWCLNGHIGFVLNGEMKIDFNGNVEEFKKGDALWIEEGEASKHKVIIEKGNKVELILFETVK